MTQGTIQSQWSATFITGLGTTYSSPVRTTEQLSTLPSYAEVEADRIIKACQSSGEVSFDRLRALIIEVIEDCG